MDYRKLCRRLIAEIRRLREANASLEDNLDWALDRAERQRRWYCEERRRQQHERELEEACRAIEREVALRDLERARSWGNTWEEERALRRLRELL